MNVVTPTRFELSSPANAGVVSSSKPMKNVVSKFEMSSPGELRAGIVAAALDSACGYAAFTLMPDDAAVLTIEFKINLLAPARGPHFRFAGHVVKPGRTINVVDGRALQRDGDGGNEALVATMTATVMTVRGRESLRH